MNKIVVESLATWLAYNEDWVQKYGKTIALETGLDMVRVFTPGASRVEAIEQFLAKYLQRGEECAVKC